MIRKYNYTGRLKISRERIQITQIIRNGLKSFEMKLMLENLGFPDYAKIYVEPYFKSSFMRFPFGTVARYIHPAEPVLTDIPVTDKILYRIKIVDESKHNGLILGFADGLAATDGNDKGNKISLLPVDFNDLGNRVWKVDMRDEGPVLSVNWDGKIEKVRDLVKEDKFVSLVYPEVIRQIAFTIASDNDFDFEEPGEGWESLWLSFFDKTLGINYFPDSSDLKDKIQWSDDISEAFCRKKDILNLLIS